MARYQIKQGDTRPSLSAVLKNADGTVINLTGAAVEFIMSVAPGETTKGGAAAVVSALQGSVRYDWVAADTEDAGEYLGEFQITFSDGTILTVPNGDYIEIEIVSELGS